MKKTTAQLKEIKLVGITARTSNALESDPSKNKIPATVQKYFHEGLAEKIQNRKNPHTTLCVYTNYKSDFTEDYTYFIGEEVTSFEGLDERFETLTIPPQTYLKFTTPPGPMPAVCIDMWKNIWSMESLANLGGNRAYIADFEVYDERSQDHKNVVLDIYIGVTDVNY